MRDICHNIKRKKSIETEGEITGWSETKDGGHVNRILKNVERDTRKNAVTYWIAAMGQWVRPTTYQENERSQLIVQWLIELKLINSIINMHTIKQI